MTTTPDGPYRDLLACCGSPSWANAMAQQWPYEGLDAALELGARIWWSLSPADWRDALSAHPRIGDIPPPGTTESREQARVATAAVKVLEELVAGNSLYQKQFGMMYVVRATGRDAGEMLAILRQRLTNDAETELRVAAGQQWEITVIRMTALLDRT